jgi:hypothetical protein
MTIYEKFIVGYSEDAESKETPSEFAGLAWLACFIAGAAFWYGVYSLIF